MFVLYVLTGDLSELSVLLKTDRFSDDESPNFPTPFVPQLESASEKKQQQKTA